MDGLMRFCKGSFNLSWSQQWILTKCLLDGDSCAQSKPLTVRQEVCLKLALPGLPTPLPVPLRSLPPSCDHREWHVFPEVLAWPVDTWHFQGKARGAPWESVNSLSSLRRESSGSRMVMETTHHQEVNHRWWKVCPGPSSPTDTAPLMMNNPKLR